MPVFVQTCQGSLPGKDAAGTRILNVPGLNPKENLAHNPHCKFTEWAITIAAFNMTLHT